VRHGVGRIETNALFQLFPGLFHFSLHEQKLGVGGDDVRVPRCCALSLRRGGREGAREGEREGGREVST
jgi:hypothetical protein